MIILIFILRVSGLIPDNVPGRSETRTVSFGYTFRDTPQVAIAVFNYDYLFGLPFGCSIEVISTTKTEFTFKATEYTGKAWNRVPIVWHAFNDESIEIINFKLEQPTMVIGLNTISKTRKVTNAGILILNGFQYSKEANFYAEIIHVTETDFTVQLNDPDSCLDWVTYQAVLGHELNIWTQGLQKIVPTHSIEYPTYDQNLVFPDTWLPFQKFAIMSFNGFYLSSLNNQRLRFLIGLKQSYVDYVIIQWGLIAINYEARYQILIYKKLQLEQSCVPIPSLDLL